MNEYIMVDKKNHKAKGKFINRELSWLDFNVRVLDCAMNKENPMNERLNFLGITGSNLEEFISVRFANAYHNQDDEPYDEILKEIKEFKKLQTESFKKLKDKIRKNYGLEFVKPRDLNKKERHLPVGKCLLHYVFDFPWIATSIQDGGSKPPPYG